MNVSPSSANQVRKAVEHNQVPVAPTHALDESLAEDHQSAAKIQSLNNWRQ